MPPKSNSPYDIVRPEGCPDWFTPGILCEVWTGDQSPHEYRRVIAWLGMSANAPWMAESEGQGKFFLFQCASPVERWKPKPGEWVAAAWSSDGLIDYVGRIKRLEKGDGDRSAIVFDSEYCRYNGVEAKVTFRLDYPDGRVIDLRGSIEEIKQRTDWV